MLQDLPVMEAASLSRIRKKAHAESQTRESVPSVSDGRGVNIISFPKGRFFAKVLASQRMMRQTAKCARCEKLGWLGCSRSRETSAVRGAEFSRLRLRGI